MVETPAHPRPNSVAALCLSALTSCASPQPSDADWYQRALRAPPSEAVALCARIGPSSMAGECGTFAAGQLAEDGQLAEALAACAHIGDPLWSDECVFVVVDTAALTGEEARKACAGAGRYRDFCFGHAVGRSIAALDPRSLPLEVGQEDALGTVIRGHIQQEGRTLPRPHQQTAWFTGMARWMAKRWETAPFDPVACGVATDDLCRRAYTETMHHRMEAVDRDTICRGTLTVEAVVAGGGTPWVPGAEDTVEAAWAALCMGVGVMRNAEQVQQGRGPRPPQERSRRERSSGASASN